MNKQEFQEQFALIEKMCREAAQYRDYNPTMAVRIRTALTSLKEEPDNKEWCEEHLQKQDFMSCSKELVVRWNKSDDSEKSEHSNEADTSDHSNKYDKTDSSEESEESIHVSTSKPARRGRKE